MINVMPGWAAFVDLNRGLEDLVAVALVAALAPMVVALLPGPRIPQIVIFLLGRVLIGPHPPGLPRLTGAFADGQTRAIGPLDKPCVRRVSWEGGGGEAIQVSRRGPRASGGILRPSSGRPERP
jgi:hypothetical protein